MGYADLGRAVSCGCSLPWLRGCLYITLFYNIFGDLVYGGIRLFWIYAIWKFAAPFFWVWLLWSKAYGRCRQVGLAATEAY
jgi:hypothetical protein